MSLWQRWWRRETPALNLNASSGAAAAPAPALEKKPAHTLAGPATLTAGTIGACVDAFGQEFLYRECARKPNQNVFVSPLSVFLAMAMAESGAGGTTKAAMRSALRLPADASQEAVARAAATLTKSLRSQGGAEIAIANALWAHPAATISPEFIQSCEEAFDAAIQTLNLSEPSAADAINRWVSEKTRGKIPGIVTPDAVKELAAVITNAVYFRAKFLQKFDEAFTRPRPFRLSSGLRKTVDMMSNGGVSRAYFSGNTFEGVALRYRDASVVLYVVLPNKGTAPEAVLTNELGSADALAKPSDLWRAPLLSLSMPKFTIEYESALKRSLADMGMGIAFEYPGADFTPMGSPEFLIGDVVHKTRLEVDEEGTVAAAATFVGVALGARVSSPPKTKSLIIDRPFGVVLRDSAAGATLFTGVVYEP